MRADDDQWGHCADDLRRWARAFAAADVDLSAQLHDLADTVDRRGPTPGCDCDQPWVNDRTVHAIDCLWRVNTA